MSQLTRDLTAAAMALAREAGGRELHGQLARAINLSANAIVTDSDMPKFTDEQHRALVSTLVNAFMSQCFNPAFSEAEHTNNLSLAPKLEQNGYNILEPLCFVPLQKVVNMIGKGNN